MLKFPSLLSVGTVFPGHLTLGQFFLPMPNDNDKFFQVCSVISVGTVFPGLLTLAQFCLPMPGQIFPSLLKVPAAAAPPGGAGVSCSSSSCSTSRRRHLLSGGPWLLLSGGHLGCSSCECSHLDVDVAFEYGSSSEQHIVSTLL